MPDAPASRPAGLTETRFGLSYYVPEMHLLFEVVDLRRKSGELWGEMTVRCRLEGMRTQLDGDRLRQGNFNFSSLRTRQDWARALAIVSGDQLSDAAVWGNFLERVCQAVLDHERGGAIHGREITGTRNAAGGRPWAAWPVLPHGETATLFAKGGAGKTTLVAMIAFGMAQGRSIVPGIRVDRPYRTVILDWETNAETADDLWGLIAESHNLAVPKGVWYEPMDAPIERSLVKISNILDHHRAEAVLVDSVTMSMGSSSDGGGDAADPITRVYQSLRRVGAWGLLIDHIAGQDYRSRKVAMKAYGSIFKMNLARHAMALHIGSRTGDTSQAYLLCPKSNVGRDRWAMSGLNERSDDTIRWEFGDPDYELYDRLMHELDEDEVPEAKLATPKNAGAYLAALSDPARPSGKTATDLGQELAVTVGAARLTLNRLKDDGLVEVQHSGLGRGQHGLWYLTQNGRAFLERQVTDDLV